MNPPHAAGLALAAGLAFGGAGWRCHRQRQGTFRADLRQLPLDL